MINAERIYKSNTTKAMNYLELPWIARWHQQLEKHVLLWFAMLCWFASSEHLRAYAQVSILIILLNLQDCSSLAPRWATAVRFQASITHLQRGLWQIQEIYSLDMSTILPVKKLANCHRLRVLGMTVYVSSTENHDHDVYRVGTLRPLPSFSLFS